MLFSIKIYIYQKEAGSITCGFIITGNHLGICLLSRGRDFTIEVTIKRAWKIQALFMSFEQGMELNHPLAILQQDNLCSIFFDAGDSDVLAANHEVDMDHGVVHAQFAVFFLAAFIRSREVFAVSCA